MVINISSREDLKERLQQEGGFVIYFYHDDCGPCRSLRPKVEKLVEEEFPKMDLLKVNAMQFPNITASFGIFSYPVLLLHFDGKEFLRFSKYISIAELRKNIERIYQIYFE